jgi:hypothetical protein
VSFAFNRSELNWTQVCQVHCKTQLYEIRHGWKGGSSTHSSLQHRISCKEFYDTGPGVPPKGLTWSSKEHLMTLQCLSLEKNSPIMTEPAQIIAKAFGGVYFPKSETIWLLNICLKDI